MTLAGGGSAVTETDATGAYAFAELGAGGTYTITPSRADLAFTPASLTFEDVRADVVADFTATPLDVTAPIMTAPSAVTADATGPEGAAVSFAVTATDDVDPTPTVSCDPAAGSMFPVGQTTVRCTATDAARNSAVATFVVEVRSPKAQVGAVGDQLDEKVATSPGDVADKVEDAAAKADSAVAELAKGDRQAALGALEGTVGDLEAAVKDGLLPAAEGRALMSRLAGAARSVAATAIAEAGARGGGAQKLAEANASLAEGDARLAAGVFKDAVNKFKDALAKAESA